MNKQISIAILTGGASSERDISLLSAQSVVDALAPHFLVEVFHLPEDLSAFLDRRASFDLVIPVIHGKGGEDGEVQGLLKSLGIPFLFSDIRAHALAFDKSGMKKLARSAGILGAESFLAATDEYHAYTHPVVVKPNVAGSSDGVSIVRSQEELVDAISSARKICDDILVEDYILGDEFTVAVIDDGNVLALPVTQIISKLEFFDRSSKYDPDLVQEVCPAKIDYELSQELQRQSVLIHNLIGARHITRSDFIVDALGKIYFLEVNTIPGLTTVSLAPQAIQVSGRNLSALLSGWISNVIS